MTATTRSTRREPVEGHTRPEDFRHRAACRIVDVAVFFPTAVRGRAHDTQVSIAKAICAGCEVRPQCLTWALSALSDGIAGGMTEHERRAEQARRRGERRGRLPRPRVPRRPVNATRAEIAAAGQAAIAAGWSVREVPGSSRSARARPGGGPAPSSAPLARNGRRGAAAATGLPSRSPRGTTPRQGLEPRKEPDPSERHQHPARLARG